MRLGAGLRPRLGPRAGRGLRGRRVAPLPEGELDAPDAPAETDAWPDAWDELEEPDEPEAADELCDAGDDDSSMKDAGASNGGASPGAESVLPNSDEAEAPEPAEDP